MLRILTSLIVVCCAFGQENRKLDNRLYWGSVAFVVGSVVADGASSYGGYEANPLVRSSDGRLGMRGIAIGAGVMGVALLVQRLCGKRHRRILTKVNFAVGGFRTAVAVRNIRLRRKDK
jgi:hypothetical protein